MNEYVNENADIFDEEPKKTNIVVRILKWIAVGIIVLITAILFARCVLSSDHDIVDDVLMNDAFYEAYEKNPDELKVEKYGMKSPWVAIREGRLVEFNELYYIPSLCQMQFSIKYNKDLPGENYGEMPFRLKLVDEKGNEYTEYFCKYASKYKFNYIRVCFENIDIYTDRVDENGGEVRHTYTLVMEMTDGNGGYEHLCDYSLYDGSTVNKNIKYKVKK